VRSSNSLFLEASLASVRGEAKTLNFLAGGNGSAFFEDLTAPQGSDK
jgi:hypothetical protein